MGIIILPASDVFGSIGKSHQPSTASNAFPKLSDISSSIRQDNGTLTVDTITLHANSSYYLWDYEQNRGSHIYNQFHYFLPVN